MAAKKRSRKPVKRIKTGGLERRITLTTAGVMAGTRITTRLATNLLGSKEKRAARRKEIISDQARYLVKELGKLKGSVVKIGQVLALYGEHFLPDEVTAALHTREADTAALHWPAIKEELIKELGQEKLDELDVEHEPIGAASLAQVHRARRKSDGLDLCLKIQYPGVAEAVDSDLNDVATLLKLAKLVTLGSDFDEWLDEVREMMHHEVDYDREMASILRFHERLRDDDRFIVPEVYPEYSTAHVLAMSFEPGLHLTDDEVQSLSQERRNELGIALLDLFLKEIFEWGEIQTDPNFGNYYVRAAKTKREKNRIVLLDYGAVQAYPASFLGPLRDMIRGAYEGDIDAVEQGSIDLGFMKAKYPKLVRRSFAEVATGIIEPMVCERGEAPESALNEKGEYCWKASDLPSRIGKRAAKSPFSPYFAIPPREFVFLSRKLVGVYTMISVLDAQFTGGYLLEQHL